MYILDTCVLRAILHNKGQQPLLERRIQSVPYEHLFITVIQLQENMYWMLNAVKKAAPKGTLVQAFDFLRNMYLDHAGFQILSLDSEALAIYRGMATVTKRIGTGDCLTAAIAIRHGYEVITHNMEDCERIPSCACDDWSRVVK